MTLRASTTGTIVRSLYAKVSHVIPEIEWAAHEPYIRSINALKKQRNAVVLAHNHPSGDPTPSADDRAVTRQLADAGRVLDIPVYDHVIIAAERYISFAETGLL